MKFEKKLKSLKKTKKKVIFNLIFFLFLNG